MANLGAAAQTGSSVEMDASEIVAWTKVRAKALSQAEADVKLVACVRSQAGGLCSR